MKIHVYHDTAGKPQDLAYVIAATEPEAAAVLRLTVSPEVWPRVKFLRVVEPDEFTRAVVLGSGILPF